LVHWIVSEEELDATVRAKVDELLSSGPEAVRAAKCLIAEAARLDRSALRSHTAQRIAEIRTSTEGQEGLRAFLEKRGPDWKQA
jgi:methylglutaconyl-CoA hydratase